VKTIRFHIKVLKDIEKADFSIKKQIFELLAQLGNGESLGMPISRPMPNVASGAHELRIRDRTGQFRVFYYLKNKDAILVFHYFQKKSERTSTQDIVTAQIRLKELL